MPKNNLSLRLDDEERVWLEEEAKSQQRSIANLIRYILREYRDTQEASRSLSIKPPVSEG